MGRSDYISDSLVHIRDRLKSYSDGNAALPGTAAAESAGDSAGDSAGAFRRRGDEARRCRRELETKLAEEIALLEKHAAECAAAAEEMRRIREQLSALPDMPAGEDPATVGNFFRDVEHLRLSYLREKARCNTEAPGPAPRSGATNPCDWLSLPVTAWAKIGFALMLPLIGALLLAALLIAIALLVSMGVW